MNYILAKFFKTGSVLTHNLVTMRQTNSFVQVVYSLFRKKGCMKTKEMAEKMGRKPANFVASLHALNKSRNFRNGFGLDLLKALEIKEEGLNALLTKQNSLDHSFVQVLDDHNQTFISLRAKYTKELVKIIGGLQNGDRFIFVTAHTPPEFNNPELHAVYLKAILRGVYFTYCFPKLEEPGFCNYLANTSINYSNYKYLSSKFEDFCKSLIQHANYLQQTENFEYNPGTFREMLEKQVTQVHSDSYLLIHAFHSYRIIDSRSNKHTQQFVLEESIAGETFGTIEDTSVDFWHQLPFMPARKIIDETYKLIPN